MGQVYVSQSDYQKFLDIKRLYEQIENIMHGFPVATRAKLWDAMMRGGKDGTVTDVKFKKPPGVTADNYPAEQAQTEWTGACTDHIQTYGLR